MAERYAPSARDRLAYKLACAVLKIASPSYRQLVAGAWQYGLAAAVRDEAEGRPAPRPWIDMTAEADNR